MAQQPRTVRWGNQQISPEALAAFYRQRSESLQNSHTVQGQETAQMQTAQAAHQIGMRPTQGILEYVLSAFDGHPGFTKP